MITKPCFSLVMSALLVMMMLATTGCTGGAVRLTPTPAKPKVDLTLAPESALPDFVREASPQVKEAYRFAIANPEVLTKFPCYCGCGKMGHRHNLDCYIKEIKPTGEIVFENHAFG